MALEFGVEEKLLIGRDRGIDLADLHADSGLATDHPDHTGGVFIHHGIVGGAHHTLMVDVM